MFDPLREKKTPVLSPGMVIQGKWKHQTYRVVRLLGQGANGSVYLVWRDQVQAALKIGPDVTALALEYTHLENLAIHPLSTCKLGPAVFELDDIAFQGVSWSILVMEYIAGIPIDQFIQDKGSNWVPLCLLKIARMMEQLHALGYSFCDLKPANILFDVQTAQARFVDFGGITHHTQAVKEFTEAYDRAWWGRGSRKADGYYDVFALGMLGVQLVAPISRKAIEYLSTKAPLERDFWLDEHLRTHRLIDKVVPTLIKMVARIPSMDSKAVIADMTNLLGKKGDLSVKNEMTLPAKKVWRRFDVTDWWLLVAVFTFVSVLFLLLWIGRS